MRFCPFDKIDFSMFGKHKNFYNPVFNSFEIKRAQEWLCLSHFLSFFTPCKCCIGTLT